MATTPPCYACSTTRPCSPGSNVAQLCGFGNKDQYIEGIIDELRRDTPYARTIRAAVRRCLTGEVTKFPPLNARFA